MLCLYKLKEIKSQIATLEIKKLGLEANFIKKAELLSATIRWASAEYEKINPFNLEGKIRELEANIENKKTIIESLKIEQNLYYQTLQSLNEEDKHL